MSPDRPEHGQDVTDEQDESFQSPLVEDKTSGLPSDAPAPLTELPEQFLQRQDPPRAAKMTIDEIAQRSLCGMPFEFVWKAGPYKGKAVRTYCAEPLCVDTGSCTGPRFVPSEPQYTTHDTEDPLRRRREMEAAEVIAAARWSARQATGKDDPRSDQAIARHCGAVIQKMRRRLRAPGDWGI